MPSRVNSAAQHDQRFSEFQKYRAGSGDHAGINDEFLGGDTGCAKIEHLTLWHLDLRPP